MPLLRTLIAVLVLSLAGTPALAQDGPAAVVVLDGSGSMAGWLDGAKASKIDMARAALQQELGKLPASTPVGLVAFGHRRKGNCTDVEIIVTPQPDGLGRTLQSLAAVQPVGKGPLVSAVRQAAAGLGRGPNRSVILLHDDLDNCAQDACVAAGEIAKSNPGVAVHVITLGGKPATKSGMACLATTTGGKQFEANDEAGLNASLAEAVRLAALDQKVPQPRPAARPDTGPALQEPGIELSASLVPGGPRIEGAISWRVVRDGQPGAPLFEERSPDLVRPTAPGRYLVEAQMGLAKASQTIDVADGKATVAQLSLDAGVISIARNAAGSEGQLMTLTRAGEGASGATPVFVGRVPGTPLVVPAGTYDIRFDDGLAHRQQRVTVRAGAETAIGQAVPSGRLELNASSAQDGPPLDAVTYSIEQDDPDAPQGRREIARSAAAQPDFTLPAGTYYITARARQVEARERLAISAGATVKQTMVLALSRLNLSAKVNASLSPNPPPLKFRVISLDGSNREVARATASDPAVTVPAGRYRIEGKLGSENAKATSDVDVSAGKDASVVLDIAAGQVSLDKAQLEAAAAAGQAIIEVRDEAGNVVWHAGSGENATALLAPGRYKYKASSGVERTIDVKGGDRQTLRLE